MPDTREKLIELLTKAEKAADKKGFYNCIPHIEKERFLADHLIANGVTIATDKNVGDKMTPTADKWISVTERLPEKVKQVLVARMNGEPGIEFLLYDGTWLGDTPGGQDEVTHWMPLPNPPKGE